MEKGSAMYNYKYTYDEFKPWTDTCEGMEVISGDHENVRVTMPFPVKYAVKDDYELNIRFILPERAEGYGKLPLVMHVQGSGWEEQNMTSHIGDYAKTVKEGFAVAIIQYRPASVAKFPAQIIDAKTAARYIYAHADELNIDKDNIFLAGDSSGGHTAVLAFLTWGEDVLDEKSEDELPPLRGLMDFYGVTSVEHIANTETGLAQEDNYMILKMLFDNPEEQMKLAEAFRYISLRKELEPVIIFHGNKDRLVPLSHSTRLYEELKKRNTQARIIMIDTADHGGPIFWNDEMKKILNSWLKEHTKR